MNNLKNSLYWLRINFSQLVVTATCGLVMLVGVLAIGYTVWLSNHYPEIQAKKKADYIELCTHADLTVGMCELRFKELQMGV